MTPFIHLHTHSEYSFFNSTAKVPNLVDAAVSMGMNAVALTDYGTLSGIPEFYKECKSKGIKPIIGIEIYVASSFINSLIDHQYDNKVGRNIDYEYSIKKNSQKITLLAKDFSGYRNLIKISNRVNVKSISKERPTICFEELKKYSNGLICISSCVDGLIPSLISKKRKQEALEHINEFVECFDENFYIGVQDHGLKREHYFNQEIIALSHRENLKLVATNDVKYIKKKDAKYYKILTRIGYSELEKTEKKIKKSEYYLKDQVLMVSLFKDIPGAIDNSIRIAEKCNADINFNESLHPEYYVPNGFNTPFVYLETIVNNSIVDKYGENYSDAIKKRIEYELTEIHKMELSKNFLMIYDLLNYAKQNNIMIGPGYGLSSGSIVAYVLGLTHLDPLKYGLSFEKFINTSNRNLPHFSISVCSEDYLKLLNYIEKQYGKESFIFIPEFPVLTPSYIVSSTDCFFDFYDSDLSLLEEMVYDQYKMLKDFMNNEKFKKEIAENTACRKIIRIIENLEGVIYDKTGIITDELVIGKNTLYEIIPVYKCDDQIVSQFPKKQLNNYNLLKLTILQLDTVAFLKCLEFLIRKKHKSLSCENINIDENDEQTFKLIGSGKYNFRIMYQWHYNLKDVFKKTKPRNFEDLIYITALYIQDSTNCIKRYKKNNDKIVHLLKKEVVDFLSETAGVLIYHEQFIKIVNEITKISIKDAENFRKILKNKNEKELFLQKKRFIQAALDNGYKKKKALKIFDYLYEQASNCINKSTLSSYLYLSYKLAYLKVKYPDEYLIAEIYSGKNIYVEELDEIKKIGIKKFKDQINELDEKSWIG